MTDRTVQIAGTDHLGRPVTESVQIPETVPLALPPQVGATIAGICAAGRIAEVRRTNGIWHVRDPGATTSQQPNASPPPTTATDREFRDEARTWCMDCGTQKARAGSGTANSRGSYAGSLEAPCWPSPAALLPCACWERDHGA